MPEAPPVIRLELAPRVRLSEATAAAFGLTRKACHRKIEEGRWLEGQEYFRAPDRSLWLDVKGIMQWVASGRR